jgi:hypothetical protein
VLAINIFGIDRVVKLRLKTFWWLVIINVTLSVFKHNSWETSSFLNSLEKCKDSLSETVLSL